MRIGIALATFNGEEFLAEQLQSIRGQRRLPNEMLVVDDASSDRTWEMLHEFQRTAPFEVTLFQNAVRQGPKASFLRAMDACRSEAIAFCDQDDMWREDKLAVCEDILAKRGARLVVHSLAHLRSRGLRWTISDRTSLPTKTVDGLHLRPERMFRGMSMMFWKYVIERSTEIQSLWEDRFRAIEAQREVSILDHWTHAHDLLVLMVARLLGDVSLLRATLAYQRWHGGNYTGMPEEPRRRPLAGSGMAIDNVSSQRSYGLLSQFCADMGSFLREVRAQTALPPERLEYAAKVYEQWAVIYAARARLHSVGTSLPTRIAVLRELAAAGGYRGEFAGGLGKKSLLKDALKSVRPTG